MLIRRLEPSDRRGGFSSGSRALDEYLQRYAGQNQFRHHLGVTYVAIDDASREVLGYLSISASSVERRHIADAVAASLPDYPLPVVRIARLAVDERARGAGLGTALVTYACELAVALAEHYGCVGLLVDAVPEAVGFYERFGFSRCDALAGAAAARPRPVLMFLPLAQVMAALEE